MARADISSLQNTRVKRVVKLREARQRGKLKRFVVDGRREIERAVAGRISLEELFVCPALCGDDSGQGLVERCAAAGAEVISVPRQVFEKIAFGDRAEGVLAVAVTPQRMLDELRLPACPLVAVLEGIEKPGNIGAILRNADGAGLDAVIVVDGGTDLFNPNTIRASLGTIFTVPLAGATSEQAAAWLRERGIRLFAAWVEGALPYTQADYTGPSTLILGSEAAGLSAAWKAPDVTAVHLPMRGAADSLNVSAAAAVLFYEALRQRTRLAPQTF